MCEKVHQQRPWIQSDCPLSCTDDEPDKMAFANLFTTLSAVSEDVKNSESTFPHSRTSDEKATGKKRCGRKRTKQDDQNISYKKSRFCQDQTNGTNTATGSFKYDYSNTTEHHMQKNNREHASLSSSQDLVFSQSREADQKNMCHRLRNFKNKTNVKKQEQKKKKTEENKNQHWQRNGGNLANKRGWHKNKPTSRKGGGGNRNKDVKQDVPVERRIFMTQEFMDQNALLVDGRVLCRHFLWGRCIKGDDCQLEHIQGYNDLIKEVCKFYVQGFCSKGEICPYMHNSFPCKFFHTRGNCSQRADCRFSHKPLTPLTKQLLDEALKRDCLLLMESKAKHELSGQPTNTGESANTEVSWTPDVLTQPIRPNFYNSTDPHAEEENLCQTEGKSDNTEDVVPSHVKDAAVSHDPPTNLHHEGPVCYSVEALLGPQISKPFLSFYAASRSTDATSPSVPQTANDCSSDTVNQSEVPYSIDTVLRSHKAARNSSLSCMPTVSSTQTVSYNPNTVSQEVTNPPINSANQNDKASYSVNTLNESNTSQGKMSLSCPQMYTSQISTWNPFTKTCSSPPLSSGVHKEQGEDTLESQKPPNASHVGKVDLYLPASQLKKSSNTRVDMKVGPANTYAAQYLTKVNGSQSQDTISFQVSVESQKQRDAVFGSGDCKNDGFLLLEPTKPTQRAFHSLFSKPPAETCIPQHPIQVKPHLPCPTGSQSSRPSSGSVKAKGRVEIQHSQRTKSGLKAEPQQHDGTETTVDSTSKNTPAVSGVGFSKTTKTAFHSLFARPITDSLQPKLDPAMSTSCPQSYIKTSSLPTPCSTECKSEDIPEVKSGKTRSFLSLFAAPFSKTPAPLSCTEFQPESARTSCCAQVSASPKSHSSDSKERASNLKTPCLFSDLVSTNVKQTSHASRTSDRPKKEKEESSNPAEQKVQTSEQTVNSACSQKSHSVSEISANRNDGVKRPEPTTNQQPIISSGSSAASTANSILKTLFLSLSPYKQCEEQQHSVQISVSAGRESSNKQQVKRKRRKKKKKRKPQDSHTQSTENTQHQPSLQTTQTSSGRTGATEAQVRTSGSHNLPITSATPPTRYHARPPPHQTSLEEKCVKGNAAVTPLRDLFKTLEPAGFHFGQ